MAGEATVVVAAGERAGDQEAGEGPGIELLLGGFAERADEEDVLPTRAVTHARAEVSGPPPRQLTEEGVELFGPRVEPGHGRVGGHLVAGGADGERTPGAVVDRPPHGGERHEARRLALPART